MLMDKINIVELFRAKSPSLTLLWSEKKKKSVWFPSVKQLIFARSQYTPFVLEF